MMPVQVTVFCPGHISGYFRPVVTSNPIHSGSIGAGIVIDSGVTVTVRPARETSVTVFQSDRSGSLLTVATDSPVIRLFLDNLQIQVAVETSCTLPLSSGYGLSAAALLGTVHAVNQLFAMGLSQAECAAHAHRIEVLCRTGLGDVSACQGGGWVIRRGPGTSADIIRSTDDQPVFAVTLGPLKTASVLSSPPIMEKIETAFPSGEPHDLYEFMTYSRDFAEDSGLISPDIRKVLTACDANHIPASMTMLGNGVFALGDNAKDLLINFGEVYSLHIAKAGPRILETLP
ncbi:MAG: GHMP kinase [Methanospirillum sp.]|uniref:pantoate kinase n=1 Tax=Methanospirillum sp. TaxID=45200 RepID=UPI00236C3516|nr:pantoate kinase [Methanospirillum sp.]MDD1729181.1 GHMP kinase [Methanospirillum sp.]